MPTPPLVGITCDLIVHNAIERAAAASAYARAVERAGGVPVLLPPVPAMASALFDRIDALVLTGGDDPRTEPFGEPTHPEAVPIHPDRQAFEVALVELAQETPTKPVLGVCLGMQLMALVAGGRLDQHMPDTTPTHEDHQDAEHAVRPAGKTPFASGTVRSRHHQCITDPGRLAVVAEAPDGVIEAIQDPSRPFYMGVQWHPERTPDSTLGQGLFDALLRPLVP
jgi:putative glutamine amidotransferase